MATLADPDWYIVNWMILFTRNPLNFSDGYTGFVSVFGWLMVAVIGYVIYHLIEGRYHRPKGSRTAPAIESIEPGKLTRSA